jgi:very-short-patch-repair endonuclease
MAHSNKALQIALSQYGLLSSRQAREHGVSPGSFRRLTRSGGWEFVLPGVVRAPGFPESWHQKLKALCLWGGPQVAVSHQSAAALHGLDGFKQGPLEIVTPKFGGAVWQAAVVHQARPVRAGLMVKDEIPVMNVLFTFLVLGSATSYLRVERALDDALYQQMVTPRGLLHVLENYGGRGVRGSATLRKLMLERRPGYVPPEGPLEADFILVVREAGLEMPERQIRIGGNRIDFSYPDLRLRIELDGRWPHAQPEQFQRDRERDNKLVIAGDRVVRYTWYDVHSRPGYVVAQLRALGVGQRRGCPISTSAYGGNR